MENSIELKFAAELINSAQLKGTLGKKSFKKEILALILLMFILTGIFFILFRFRNNEIFLSFVQTSREARIIMIYHSLSIPFIAVCTFWLLEFYNVREKMILTIKILILPGTFIASISGAIFAYTRIMLFHDFFYLGMFLVFISGCVFLASVWLKKGKFPYPEEELPEGSTIRGWSIEYFILTILAMSLLISSIIGALAAMENFVGTAFGLNPPREPIAFLAEYIIHDVSHDIVENSVKSHLHIMLVEASAMVMMIAFRYVKMPKNYYKFSLLLCIPGIIIISIGTWLVVFALPIAHMIIYAGSSFLLLASLFIIWFGWKEVAMEELREKYDKASFWKRTRSSFSDPIKSTFYFLLFFSYFVITLPGLIVAANLEKYRTPEYYELEIDFSIGHWHMLATLIATMLLLLAIDYYNVKGKIRKITGITIFLASLLSFGGGTAYTLRPLPDTIIEPYFMITIIGISFLFIGYTLGIFIIYKAYIKDRKQLKKANEADIQD
ncbi:hypothetical protein DSAG12_02982 [Promethearchaeum syntrophicum]|uniref:Cytochrome oxidase subunit I profile domain-containing protein n=1 Tax=Promethearchaeum syntrophicum TaxID=2594042 RepID=A0A5B9DEC8_9ARCH|nr:hypothetical protein [Candidatus Prometheoarchaeum syntrophicum]QEE17150.1 hypothetical protein DSAG12_02982 [Candidatus Prometheoarchaeum syntrophicum]